MRLPFSDRIDWRSPYTVMVVVLTMYALKVAGKLLVGWYAQSPMIFGDGLHNVADVGEALLVMFAIVVSRLEREGYPFGLKKTQNLGQLAVSVSLGLMALTVASRALSGIVAQLPAIEPMVRDWLPLPAHKPLKFGLKYLPWVAGVMGVSTVLSWLIGRFQIRIGRATGQSLLMADGQETQSDGRIELAAFLGIVFQYLLGIPWLEYPLTLMVALLMAKTAFEIGRDGIRSLLQRSLGAELERDCCQAARAIPGVLTVEEIKTFSNGDEAVCLIKALIRRPQAEDDLRHAIKHQLQPVMAEAGHIKSLIHVRFHAPPLDRHRRALTVHKGGPLAAMAPLLEADVLRIANMEDGEPVRIDDYPLHRYELTELIALLQRKRVREVWSRDHELDEISRTVLESHGIAWRSALPDSPETLGC